MAATLAVYVVVQVLVTVGVRPHLLPTMTLTVPVDRTTMIHAVRFDRSMVPTGPVTIDLPAPAGSWVRSETTVLDSTGHPIQTAEILDCWNRSFSQPGASGKAGSPDFGPLGACMAPDDLHVDIGYQPAGRYWQLQWVETALYAALAVLLGAASWWRIRGLRA